MVHSVVNYKYYKWCVLLQQRRRLDCKRRVHWRARKWLGSRSELGRASWAFRSREL